MRNGHLLYTSNVKGLRGGVFELDMLGNVLERWYPRALAQAGFKDGTLVDTDTLHHDILELPSGNFLALSTEIRAYEGYPSDARDPNSSKHTREVAGDVIIEFARDGSVVNRWALLDLLDPHRIGYGSLGTNFWRRTYEQFTKDPQLADWAHANAIAYDERDHAVLVSARHQDVTLKIDLAKGGIVWMLGPHDGWKEPWQPLLLAPTGPLEWAYHTHGLDLTPERTILVFDNGNHRAVPFAPPMPADKSFSRAVEFAVDEDARQVRQVWSYGGPNEELFFSSFLGDADWLPQTGNVLITDGARVSEVQASSSEKPPAHNWARIVEVTHTSPAEKVFELVLDDVPPRGWRVYRAERLPSLYP